MFTNFVKSASIFLKENNKLITTLIFGLLIFLSIFPRGIEVINQNPIFGFDQGREMLAAKQIVVDHKLILIGTEVGAGQAGVSGLFHGPLYYYMLTIPFVLFNGDPSQAVWLMFLFGIFTIVLSYFLGRRLFGFFGGLLVALLFSISPVFIAQSRFIWSPNPPTFSILLTYFFTFIMKKSPIYITLAAFFAAFVYNFELGIAVPLSLSLFIYSIFVFKKDLKKILFLFPGFIFGYLPMMLFEARHGFIGTKSIFSYLTSPHVQTSDHSLFYYLNSHANEFSSAFQGTFPTNSFFHLFIILLLLLSIYFIRKEKVIEYKHFFSFLLLIIPVTFLVFAPLRNTIWNFYLLHLNVVYILLFSYIVFSIYRYKSKIISIVAFFVIFILIILGLNNAIQTFNHDINDYGGTAKVKGKIDAIDFIYKSAHGGKFGLLVFSPPVYTYPYDYLLWWYGNRKYHYIPQAEKKGEFYLLIEEDNGQPWSYKGWLQTVIKVGKVEWTKTLPSGFIVQKRSL